MLDTLGILKIKFQSLPRTQKKRGASPFAGIIRIRYKGFTINNRISADLIISTPEYDCIKLTRLLYHILQKMSIAFVQNDLNLKNN